MIEQVPAVSMVTVVPLTVQTGELLEVKVTTASEVAVALTVNGETPRNTLLRLPNEMVCGAGLTVIEIVLLEELALPEPPL